MKPAFALALVPLLFAAQATAADKYPGVGRAATPAEIQAWDIDVRPDFKGLPKGSGSVEQGQVIWENKCASCHGTFGESNKFFSPLVGGVTGEFNGQTVAALRSLQKVAGFKATGSLDERTAKFLGLVDVAPIAANALPSVGMSGDTVWSLQQALINAGTPVKGGADGKTQDGARQNECLANRCCLHDVLPCVV
ncbi:MAG: hypothetical protein EBZ55_01175 [Actinobacteria bacterium]|nr:hypothetical protein [Actinomycetota bacterium]